MSDPFQQHQFLTVIDRDEAIARFRSHLDSSPLNAEAVPLAAAAGRVLAADVVAPIDIPAFDRSNVDGFAVRAEETFGATESHPILLNLLSETIAAGANPHVSVGRGDAAALATGAIVPRGASAIVPIEHTEANDGRLRLIRPATPGANITFAGTDVGRGETILHSGTRLTSRETGILAALGINSIDVVRRPRVGIISTGDELRSPGEPLPLGCVYDSNATVLADAVRELGCDPLPLGIVPDRIEPLRAAFREAVARCDAVLLSGGTSKGEHDLSYRVVDEFGPPGIVAHGIALKPGKPLCLAVVPKSPRAIPVAVLPGFPTSALFTFNEFFAPVLRDMAGLRASDAMPVNVTLPFRLTSEKGRTEFVLVSLIADALDEKRFVAIPIGKGSGSVTAFARADGFITIPRQCEYLETGETVEVRLLAEGVRPADLVVIGSHCIGIDLLVSRLQARGLTVKTLAVGSTAGLETARRGECDVAGIHLLDPVMNEYNRPFVTDELELIPGYRRRQGIVLRPDDSRLRASSASELRQILAGESNCIMVNRNRGSGTRILIDEFLGGAKPPGYLVEAVSHHAVVAAVVQGRADWGLAIESVARPLGLGFVPLRDEQFDFIVPRARLNRPAVIAFRELLQSPEIRTLLKELGFI